ncbi:MAG TPA: hypothetical protein VGE76_22045 [Opitutaceae bacterium]
MVADRACDFKGQRVLKGMQRMSHPDFPARSLRRIARGFAGALMCFMCGCQQTKKEPPPAGTSTHRFVVPVTAQVDAKPVWPTETQPPVEMVHPAEPIEPLAQPLYPVEARGRQSMLMTVGVRIVIDEKGQVAELRHSPLAFTTPGPFAEEFRAAVEDALRKWRFLPAQRQKMTPMAGGPAGRYWHVTKLGPTADQLDVLFTFTPSGEVVSARP